MTLSKRITDVLREARENSLLRTLRTVDRWEECRLMVQGKQLIDFSSSDYLGLAYDPEVLAFIEKKLSDHGLGTASSPLITGHTSLHSAVEGKLATIYTQEGSLLFPSGWQSNVTLLPSLFGESDVILSDERNHASLIDGARLSRARVIVYAHRDYDDLERKLIEAADIAGEDGLIGITSDTVFSIEGDAADVATLVELKGKYKAALILDAAHGLPSIGTDGESLLGFDEHLVKADAVTTSLGKYFAAGGGMVASTARMRELLVNRARGYIYSGSISPLALTALLAVIGRIEEDPSLVRKLKQNIEYVRASLADLGMLGRSIGSEGPICAIPVKPGRAVAAGEKLIEMGLLLTPIRFPSVPEGSAMLRVSIMRGHTREMMDELFSALGELKVEGYMPDAE